MSKRTNRISILTAAAAAAAATVVAPHAVLAQHEEAVAPLIEPYWTRGARAVQRRSVSKGGAVELSAALGVIPTEPLRVYVPVGLRLAYHLSEHWALEGAAAYNLRADRSLAEALENSGADPRVWQREAQRFRMGIALVASPLYGKLAAGAHVVLFEPYVLAGAGIVQTTEVPALSLREAIRPEIDFGLGLRLLFGTRLIARLEYRQHLYFRPAGGIDLPAELAALVGVLLGGRR